MWLIDCKNGLNSSPLPLSTHFAMSLYSSSHKGLESMSPPFSSGSASWLALANRIWQKWQCASLEPGPKRPWTGLLFLGNPPRSHVNKLGLAYRKVRDHIEQRKVISAVPAKAQDKPESLSKISKPNPQITRQLTAHAWVNPAKTRRTTHMTYRLWVNKKCLLFFGFFKFLAVLGLHCCARAPSSCGERGPLLAAVRGPLIAVASPVEDHGLYAHGLSSCGSQTLECRLSSCGTQAQWLWLTGSRAQAQ